MNASASSSAPSTPPRDPRLLIDGYNVLFQSQLVGKGRGKLWLQRARERLLTLLQEKLSASEQRATQIVFDASRASDSTNSYRTSQGLTVTFATEYPEADDLIEEILRTHSHPKNLRVISSDQRIRRRAIARRAQSIDAESFLNELHRPPSKHVPPPVSAETPAGTEPLPSHEEIEFWLKEFGH